MAILQWLMELVSMLMSLFGGGCSSCS